MSAAQRAVAAERARLEAAAAEEAARAEAARLAAEARRVAAEAEAVRARELVEEERRRAAAARARRAALRLENADAVRRASETREALRKLDSSIKKNTALTKKLGKGIGAETKESLLRDVANVNASKYVAENVFAVAFSATIKATPGDGVLAAAEVVSLLHRMYYPEFGEALGDMLPRAICPDAPKGAFASLRGGANHKKEKEKGIGTEENVFVAGDASSAETANDSFALRRARLRLLAEAHLVGVVESAKPVFAAVAELIRSADARRDKEHFAHVLASLAAFAKNYGDAFVREEDDESDTASLDSYRLTPERRGAFRDALRSFHVAASVALLDERRATKDAERESKKVLARTGELSESLTLRVAELEKSREYLRRNLEVLTEALGGEKSGVRMPPDDTSDADDEASGKKKGDVFLSKGVDVCAERSDAAFWDDETSRVFYESLPALRETVPKGLLPPEKTTGEEGDDGAAAAERNERAEPTETSGRLAEFDKTVSSKLRACGAWTTHADADAFASAFCYFAAGPVARRLITQVFVERIKSESLRESDTATPSTALLARVLATLKSASKTFDEEIVAKTIDAFRETSEEYFFRVTVTRKKENPAVDRKLDRAHLGSVRFLGELVKFRALDPEWAFAFLKKCTETFAGNAVNAACALLQTCGRYLARRRDTSRRANALLDVFFKLKAVHAKKLEPGQSELVDATYLACRPPPVAARTKKKQNPTRAYVAFVVDRLCREWRPPPEATSETSLDGNKKDVFVKKNRASGDDAVRRCVRQLRKVNWAEHGRYAVSRLLKGATRSGRVESSMGAARAVATLDRFRENAAQMFVDALMEETVVLAELDDVSRSRFAQRRVALGRAIGEAFVARLVPATAVFAHLFSLLAETRRTETETETEKDGSFGVSGSVIAAKMDRERADRRVSLRASLATLAACRPRLAPDADDAEPGVPRRRRKSAKDVRRRKKRASFETRRYLAYLQRFAFVADVASSPELSADLRATLAEYLGPGDEAFAFESFADADAACAGLEAEERARLERAPGAPGPGGAAGEARPVCEGESDESGDESEAEDEDDKDDNFEDFLSDPEADDAMDEDVGADVGGDAPLTFDPDAADSDSSRGGADESDDDDTASDASTECIDDGSGSASESESESDESDASGSNDESFSSDDDAKPSATARGGQKIHLPVASREDEARFEREMASFLGSAAPRLVNPARRPALGTNDTIAETFDVRTPNTSARREGVGEGDDKSARRVAFKALVRRDGRPSSATVGVPEDASFVVSARENQAAEARERAELKRLVLASAEAAEARETEAGTHSLASGGEDRKKFTVFSSATFSRVSGGGRGARGFGAGDKRG